MDNKGMAGKFSGLLRDKETGKFSPGKIALGGLLGASVALPFMGGDDEDDGPVDQMDPAAVTQRARNFYSGQGGAGVGLDFMPQKKYVNQNFYTQNAADGGRIGRKFGSPNPRKTNVEKIKQTFGPKKNVPSKLKGFSKLPEKVQQQMNKKLARKV